MHPRQFALYGGVIMLLAGLIALMYPGPTAGLPDLKFDTSYGWFLGEIPMNVLNKFALMVFGVAGVMASNMRFTSLPASILYARAVFFVMGTLAILGMFRQTFTLGGYWPLFGSDVVFHAAVAVIGCYFGYALTSRVPEVKRGASDYRNAVRNV